MQKGETVEQIVKCIYLVLWTGIKITLTKGFTLGTEWIFADLRKMKNKVHFISRDEQFACMNASPGHVVFQKKKENISCMV